VTEEDERGALMRLEREVRGAQSLKAFGVFERRVSVSSGIIANSLCFMRSFDIVIVDIAHVVHIR
jgi:hypothetical protein